MINMIFTMYYEEFLTTEEIASALKVNESYVKSVLGF